MRIEYGDEINKCQEEQGFYPDNLNLGEEIINNIYQHHNLIQILEDELNKRDKEITAPMKIKFQVEKTLEDFK